MQFSNRDDLRDYIHDIHNFLRNSGVGYGQTGMKIFCVFYGLKLINPLLNQLNIKQEHKDILNFNKLVEFINQDDVDKTKIIPYITNIIDFLKQSKNKGGDYNKINQYIYFSIPLDIKEDIYIELINRINELPVGYSENSNVNLSGKVYEYFIGRDKTAISELGAYFTERYITEFCFSKINIEPVDGQIKTMIDPFGGSGGFTLGYATFLRKNYPDIDWTTNVNNIYHFDMEQNVVNMTGLELFAITGNFPKQNTNFDRTNSFQFNFNNKNNNVNNYFDFVLTNPPYGGDKTSKNEIQIKNEKLMEIIKNKLQIIYDMIQNLLIKKLTDKITKTNLDKLIKKLPTTKDIIKLMDTDLTSLDPELINDIKSSIKKILESNKFFIKKNQLSKIKTENDRISDKNEKQQVNHESCGNRIINFLDKYEIDNANDKEACSFALIAELLAPNGVAVAVLKEGVFFDSKYSNIRKTIIENYNVTNVISVPQDAFENTTTKTSIIIFKNNGQTQKVQFSELIVEKEEKDIDIELENGEIKITKFKDDIKTDESGEWLDVGVYDKITSYATYEQLSTPIIKNGKKKYNYSLNAKDYKNYVVDCPEGFELVKLEKYLTFLPKSKRAASYASENGDYTFYTSSDKIKKCDTCDFNDKQLKIIFGDGGKGSLFIDNKFSCSDHNIVCITNDINETLYIYNYIKNNWDDFIEKMFNGSVLGNIGKERLNNCIIPFPKDINKIKPQLDKLYKLHQSISQMTEDIPLKEKIICDTIKKATDDGKEGIDYTVSKFNNVIDYQSKKIKYKASAGKTVGKYKFYTSSQDKIMFINDEPMFKETMLIMGRNGETSVHYDNNFSCEHDHVYVMKVINNDTQYLYYYIKNNIEWFKSQMNGSVIKGTSKDILGKFNIKILSDKQMKKTKLLELFDEVDTLKETSEKTKQEYDNEIKELFKDFKKPKETTLIEDNTSEELETDITVVKPKKDEITKLKTKKSKTEDDVSENSESEIKVVKPKKDKLKSSKSKLVNIDV